MVAASINVTEGKGFPIDMGAPRSLILVSPLETLPPGSLDPWSTGTCGFTEAHPNNIRIIKHVILYISFLKIITCLLRDETNTPSSKM
jgi:hypothetical protein